MTSPYRERVAFDLAIRASKASMQRLGQAICEGLLLVTDAFQIQPQYKSDWHMRAFIKPEDVETVRERLKASVMHYYGRTYFDNGSIIRIHDTPEDELVGKVRSCYTEFLATRKAKELEDQRLDEEWSKSLKSA